MDCAGCFTTINGTPAAFAIMNLKDIADLGMDPTHEGPTWPGEPNRRFGAVPVCEKCYTVPTSRKRKLKAHFALPEGLRVALGMAGSSTGVSG